MHDEQAASGSSSAPGHLTEISSVGQAVARGKHIRPRASDSEAVAALAATGGQDRATRTGAHPQAEAVHLVTATVVRLVRTLAHDYSTRFCRESQSLGRVQDRVARQRSRQSSGRTTGTARPRESHQEVAGRGHAAPVEPVSTCKRYVAGRSTVNSRVTTPRETAPKGAILHAPEQIFTATRRRITETCGEPVDPVRPQGIASTIPTRLRNAIRRSISPLAHPAQPVDKGVDRTTRTREHKHQWSQQQAATGPPAGSSTLSGPQFSTAWHRTSACGSPPASR